MGAAIRRDNRTSVDLAVVDEMVRLGRPLQREVLDQHVDLCQLSKGYDLHELGDRAQPGWRNGALVCRALPPPSPPHRAPTAPDPQTWMSCTAQRYRPEYPHIRTNRQIHEALPLARRTEHTSAAV